MRNRDPAKIRRYAPLYPPIPVPGRDWCEEPKVGLCINEDWAQLIVGLLEVLRCEDLWDTTNPRHVDVARSVQSLMDAINDPNLCGDSVCDTIADCISTSPSTQQALAVVLNTNFTLPLTGGAPNNPLPFEVTDANLLPDTYECDQDHAFATARAIVEAIGDTTLGVLEAFELYTNPAEVAEEVVGIIPILGQIVAVGIKVLNWMQDNVIELYRAAWNDVTRDIIACELYCVILNDPNCSISFDQVWDIYMSLYTGDKPSRDDGAEVWFLWLIEQAILPGVLAVKAGGVLGLICMLYGSKFGGFGLGVRSLEMVIALAADETSDDWQFLCDECPATWTMYGNLVAPVLPAFVVVTIGDFVPDTGVVFACSGGAVETKEGRVEIEPGFEWDMLSMRLDYRYTLGSTGGSSINQAVFDGHNDGQYVPWRVWQFGYVQPGKRAISANALAPNCTRVQYRLRSSRNACDGAGELEGLYIQGQGPNPFLNQPGWVQV